MSNAKKVNDDGYIDDKDPDVEESLKERDRTGLSAKIDEEINKFIGKSAISSVPVTGSMVQQYKSKITKKSENKEKMGASNSVPLSIETNTNVPEVNSSRNSLPDLRVAMKHLATSESEVATPKKKIRTEVEKTERARERAGSRVKEKVPISEVEKYSYVVKSRLGISSSAAPADSDMKYLKTISEKLQDPTFDDFMNMFNMKDASGQHVAWFRYGVQMGLNLEKLETKKLIKQSNKEISDKITQMNEKLDSLQPIAEKSSKLMRDILNKESEKISKSTRSKQEEEVGKLIPSTSRLVISKPTPAMTSTDLEYKKVLGKYYDKFRQECDSQRNPNYKEIFAKYYKKINK